MDRPVIENSLRFLNDFIPFLFLFIEDIMKNIRIIYFLKCNYNIISFNIIVFKLISFIDI